MGRLATQWLQDGHLWKVRMVDDDDGDDDDGDDDDDHHHHHNNHHHDKSSTHEHRHNHQNHLGFPPQSDSSDRKTTQRLMAFPCFSSISPSHIVRLFEVATLWKTSIAA